MTTIRYRIDFGRPRRPAPRPDKVDAASPPAPELPPRKKRDPRASAAELLAVAHFVERGLLDGSLTDFDHAVATVGVSRCRLSQILRLLDLEPALQEAVLLGHEVPGEHGLREATDNTRWHAVAQTSGCGV